MRHLLFLTVVGLLVAPVPAGSDVLPIEGVRYVNYDAATGEITPITATTRSLLHPLWSAGYEYVGWIYGRNPFQGEAASDWGDVAGPAVVGGLEFSSYTNSSPYDGDLWIAILFYTEDNGFCSAGKTYAAGILIENVPGQWNFDPWAYRWRLKLDVPFVLDGSDLDGDGLGDFGYFMFFSGRTPGCLHGPGLWGDDRDPTRPGVDPNNLPPEAPGVDMFIDRYKDPLADQNAPQDPNSWNAGWHNIDPDNINAAWVATSYFNPGAYGQFHMVLFAPSCPNRGEAGRFCTADIDGSFDCIVGLADLSQLLAHYGMTSGATLSIGDVDPYDEWMLGDGDVDLGDLAELLSQYGDDCNWPRQ